MFRKRLTKTINGKDCEIYAISHHKCLKVGKAEPDIEIYENIAEVPTIGANTIQQKKTYFSIVVCPNPEMDESITDEVLRGLTAFDMTMYLPNKKDVYVPFDLYGVCAAKLSPDRWEFEVTDPEIVRKLLTL